MPGHEIEVERCRPADETSADAEGGAIAGSGLITCPLRPSRESDRDPSTTDLDVHREGVDTDYSATHIVYADLSYRLRFNLSGANPID
jgi:hypothetical protein